MRFLITQSLVSSWSYLFSCREECQDDALAEFNETLYRVPKMTTQEMQNGLDFEDEVYKVVRGDPRTPHPKWENGINAVATRISGAKLQVKAYREFSVGGIDLLLYGVFDALRAGTIYDVKFSNKGFGSAELAGKYLDSPQHPAYLYLEPDAREFTYLVSDGEDLYTETYTRKNTRSFEEIAAAFLTSIEAMGLMHVYKSKWETK